MKTKQAFDAEQVFLATVWSAAEAGRCRYIKEIRVSPEVYDTIIIEPPLAILQDRITRDPHLPELSCVCLS